MQWIQAKKDQNNIHLCTSNGSATLEYSMVMPVLLFVVILFFYVVLAIHNRAVLQAVASDTASALSRVWRDGNNAGRYLTSGVYLPEDIQNRPLYWQLSMALSDETEKMKNIEAVVVAEARKKAWLPLGRKDRTADVQAQIHVRGGIPYGTLTVSISLYHALPGAGFFRKKGFQNYGLSVVSATALVTDGKSTIQEVDWALQALDKTPFPEMIEEVVDPIKLWVSKMQRMQLGWLKP